MSDDSPDLVDLDFLAPANPGPLGGPRSGYVEFVRDLTEADMAAHATMPRATKVPSLVRIHASHHALARCLASGMKQAQAALVTGYTTARIAQLERDPAFIALVSDYRTEIRSVFADMAERMSNVSLDALELLQERLNDSPEGFTIPMLLDVVKAFADRTGYGPGAELTVRAERDLIDRPPRESFEEWKARRDKELEDGPDTIN